MHATERKNVLSHPRRNLPTKTRIPLICIGERNSNNGRPALKHLEREGFGVSTFPMASDVIPRLGPLHPSLIIIETPLAGGSALDLCRDIRWVNAFAGTPVIFLAANPTEEERVLALEAGADDYMAESWSGREVVARVRAVMRRFARQVPQSWTAHISTPFLHSLAGTVSPTISTGEIEIDPTAMKISVRGTEIAATGLEFRFLYYLVQNQDRVFTREQLLAAVWGSQHVEMRSVDACVRRLRRKIERDPSNPTCLRAFRGAGYYLQAVA